MNLQSLSKAAASLGESNLLDVALWNFIRGIENSMLPARRRTGHGMLGSPRS